MRKQQGMTLLELLVAAGVMAVMAGLAFMGLNNMATAKRVIDDQSQAISQQNMALYWLQNDLQMAITDSHQLTASEAAEFTGNSQSISMLRFQSPIVASGRQASRDPLAVDRHGLIRVRWYVRNNQWYRTSQSAFAPQGSQQWLERPMMAVRNISCQYLNLTGQIQPAWPQAPIQRGQLPQRITCGLTDESGQSSVIKVVPWQHLGFL